MSRLSEDLRARTKHYASETVLLYVSLPRKRKEVEVLGHQQLRAGTSVAAHAREASRGRSDAEFCSKLEGLLQEADESMLWLELLKETCGITSERLDFLLSESDELISVFSTMVTRVKEKNRKKP
jgi:four helix bundle protein